MNNIKLAGLFILSIAARTILYYSAYNYGIREICNGFMNTGLRHIPMLYCLLATFVVAGFKNKGGSAKDPTSTALSRSLTDTFYAVVIFIIAYFAQ